DRDIAAVDPAELTQPLHKGGMALRRHRRRGHAEVADGRQLRRLLRARRGQPRSRRAPNQRDELAASHCPMPPVLPTERIAHLGTADCCINPRGRNEMIEITPLKIFSKEVAQKQATPLTAPATSLTTKNRFMPNLRG